VIEGPTCAKLATMWTHLTDGKAEVQATLDALSALLKRDPVALAGQVLIGSAGACGANLARYADAGVDTAFIWPVGNLVQLRRSGAQVVPHLR
jgi:alkanesulfonate monooxygenase SsuD/methylene tetrahydromethanopterin reductase-like flavin-dependent oxidoreductase (luciferase family)